MGVPWSSLAGPANWFKRERQKDGTCRAVCVCDGCVEQKQSKNLGVRNMPSHQTYDDLQQPPSIECWPAARFDALVGPYVPSFKPSI